MTQPRSHSLWSLPARLALLASILAISGSTALRAEEEATYPPVVEVVVRNTSATEAAVTILHRGERGGRDIGIPIAGNTEPDGLQISILDGTKVYEFERRVETKTVADDGPKEHQLVIKPAEGTPQEAIVEVAYIVSAKQSPWKVLYFTGPPESAEENSAAATDLPAPDTASSAADGHDAPVTPNGAPATSSDALSGALVQDSEILDLAPGAVAPVIEAKSSPAATPSWQLWQQRQVSNLTSVVWGSDRGFRLVLTADKDLDLDTQSYAVDRQVKPTASLTQRRLTSAAVDPETIWIDVAQSDRLLIGGAARTLHIDNRADGTAGDDAQTGLLVKGDVWSAVPDDVPIGFQTTVKETAKKATVAKANATDNVPLVTSKPETRDPEAVTFRASVRLSRNLALTYKTTKLVPTPATFWSAPVSQAWLPIGVDARMTVRGVSRQADQAWMPLRIKDDKLTYLAGTRIRCDVLNGGTAGRVLRFYSSGEDRVFMDTGGTDENPWQAAGGKSSLSPVVWLVKREIHEIALENPSQEDTRKLQQLLNHLKAWNENEGAAWASLVPFLLADVELAEELAGKERSEAQKIAFTHAKALTQELNSDVQVASMRAQIAELNATLARLRGAPNAEQLWREIRIAQRALDDATRAYESLGTATLVNTGF